MIKEFVQGPMFPWVLSAVITMLLVAAWIFRPKRKPLPPSDLEKVEFFRRGTMADCGGSLWMAQTPSCGMNAFGETFAQQRVFLN